MNNITCKKFISSTVAILIPAYNENKVIASTLKSLYKLVPKKNIFVVDSGSNDNTKIIALKYTKNVLITTNHGKALALNLGIKYFNLTKRYQYIFFMDADTRPKPNFLENVMKHFKNDPHKKIVCVVGQVKNYGVNWISKFRQWEYHISHFIHKKGQENLKSILVVPGCATVYRSCIFDKLKFPKGTLTEDMDFTFLLHRKGYNGMVFENKAIVYTQDPQNLRDYILQLKRWYTGFWQVVRKYDIPWQGQILDLEVIILALEGLYNGLIIIFFIFSILPLFILGGINIFVFPLLIDLFIFFIPTLIWSSIIDKDFKKLYYIPQFYFLRILSSLIFLKSFFDGFTNQEKEYSWDSNRYAINTEVT
jgi:cellulose synthase/poly-beta-1,6-N-acetylglucosamine synthase-like glycosyltransferase